MKFKAVLTKDTGWVIVPEEGRIVLANLSPSKAKKVANALNVILRAETFKPKSQGRRARSKGHSFEREVAIALRCVFPKVRRHLEYQDAEANGVDLVETEYFKFQCKKLKKYAPLTMIEEVVYDEFLGEVPVLVTAGDGKQALAALPFTDFVCLLKAIRQVKNP